MKQGYKGRIKGKLILEFEDLYPDELGLMLTAMQRIGDRAVIDVETVEGSKEELFRRALAKYNGNMTQAAAAIGLSQRQAYRWNKKIGKGKANEEDPKPD